METEGTTAEQGTAEEAPELDDAHGQEATEAVTDDTPWSLDEVDEGIRPDVERWINSARPAMTRKFQEASELRKQAEAAMELQESLGSPETAYESLSELLGNYGIDLPAEVWEQATNGEAPEAAESYEDFDDEPEEDSAVLQRLEALEKERQDEQEGRARAERRGHVDTFYGGFAKERGYGETVNDVPDEVRNVIASIAAAMPFGDDGMPDMQGAQELAEAFAAHEVERYLKAKRGPRPPKGGGPGERRADLSSTKERLKVAEEVAGRHFA